MLDSPACLRCFLRSSAPGLTRERDKQSSPIFNGRCDGDLIVPQRAGAVTMAKMRRILGVSESAQFYCKTSAVACVHLIQRPSMKRRKKSKTEATHLTHP